MPERVVSMAPSSGHASPGPQVSQAATDRPIPARRRSAHTVSGLDVRNSSPVYAHDPSKAFQSGPGREDSSKLMNDIERRRYPLTSSGYPTTRPVSTVRPQSALAVTSPQVHPVERPPSSLGVAWGQKYGANRQTVDPRPTLPRDQQHPPSTVDHNGMPGRWMRQGEHPGYEDGELIQPPLHQRSRSYGDGVNASPSYQGDHVGHQRPEDVYAIVSRASESNKGHQMLPGYVGNEQQRPVSRQGVYSPGPQYPSHPGTPGQHRAVGRMGERGSDPSNLAQGDRQWGRQGPGKPSQSHDLRSAWQRLYGNRPEPQVGNRRPSVEDIARAQTPQHNMRVQSPHFHNQPAHSRPMVSVNDSSDSALSYHNTSHHSVHQFSQPSHTVLMSGRESPTGQSSSNPEQVSNNSSQLSSYSTGNKAVPPQQRNMSTFKPKLDAAGAGSNTSLGPVDPMIGPAAKYPSQRGNTPGPERVHFHNARNPKDDLLRGITNRHTPNDFLPRERSRLDSASPATVEFIVSDAPSPRPLSRHKTHAPFDHRDDLEGDIADYPSLNPTDSVFDYPGVDSEDDDSVSPPLPPLSSTSTPRGSGHATPTNLSPRHPHKNRDHLQKSPPKTPDLLRANASLSGSRSRVAKREFAPQDPGQVNERPSRPAVTGANFGESKRGGNQYVRSRSLDDVRESDNESTLSFDVENTLLMVEPSDQSEMGTLRSHRSNGSMKAQLSRLEGMYSHVMKTLEENATQQAPRTRRRWSIGSSDTSSFHQHSHSGKHGAHGRTSAHKMSSRDVRTIGKRFQRLESHVITLARSVAHLSSELRSHNSVTREIELVKREMAELKTQGRSPPTLAAPRNAMGGNILMTDFERYRGWVPSLTNPRRVNKLTKFFGQEPPLLEIFLKRLGYERYAKNFEDEHIGMIELPYMTEERLQAIGIPMGPRLRILQEAQLCFKQGNFDVYFV